MPDTTLRDDLEASFKELGNADGKTPLDTGAPSALGGEEHDFSQGLPDKSTEDRDASGKLAPKTPAEEQVPTDKQASEKQVASEIVPSAVKAPASWKPEEREGFDKIAPHHRAAILRREAEQNQTLQQTAQVRRFAEEFTQTLQPFIPMIQSEGSNPLLAIQTMMTTAHTLRYASPEKKAEAVAQLITQFNVPVEALDASLSKLLSGKPAVDPAMASIQRLLDEKLQPVQRFITDFQSQGQRELAQSATQELESFLGDPKNEFAKDVAEDMADLLELAAKRGQILSLSDAYKRATMAHPQISGVIASRSVGNAAAQQSAAAGRARAASASLPSGGTGGDSNDDVQGDGSVRADLLASVRSLNARR